VPALVVTAVVADVLQADVVDIQRSVAEYLYSTHSDDRVRPDTALYSPPFTVHQPETLDCFVSSHQNM